MKMDKQASEMLGETVIAGVALDSQAAVRKAMKSGAGGVLGALAGSALAGIDVKEASAPGDHNGSLYMTVGENKIGFFSTKQGLFKNSLAQLLAQHSRNDVKAFEIEKGVMSTVHIVLQDGTHYVMLCPKFNQKQLKKVQEVLTP